MVSSFLGARKDPTAGPRQLFCSYLHSEIEEIDFLSFKNETVKLLSEIQYKAKEHKRQVTTSQQVTAIQVPQATHTRTRIHTRHPRYSTSLHTSFAAYSDCYNTACCSDCQTTATSKANISISTTNLLRSCG